MYFDVTAASEYVLNYHKSIKLYKKDLANAIFRPYMLTTAVTGVTESDLAVGGFIWEPKKNIKSILLKFTP